MSTARQLAVSEPSQAAEARRVAMGLARELRFDETGVGEVALVVTEAATNLLKHAGGGELVLAPVEGDGGALDVLALDRGPGIADVERSLEDGYSTAGSPGTGLGAMRRLAAVFDIGSGPGAGTAVLARLGRRAPAEPAGRLAVGGLSLPHPREETSGDAWTVRATRVGARILVVDGLGHGTGAAEAARGAVGVFEANPGLAPGAMLGAIHAAIRHTRGAACAVAEVDLDRRLVCFAGVGNIAGAVIGPAGTRSLVSHNGIVGHQMRRVQEFDYPWPPAGLLVLHSDGLATHWSLDRYPALARRHPTLVAGLLYRDFSRRSDDVTVVIAREVGA